MTTRLAVTAWVAALGSSLVAPPGAAQPPPGTPIENLEAPTLGGGKATLLGKAKVNVLFFFRPAQEHSATAMMEMASCEKEMQAKSVHWVGVVSAHFPPAEVAQAVKEGGIKMPVILDKDDEIYGRLKVALHPVVILIDEQHRMHAFEPYRRINFCSVVRARILHMLKEMTDVQLEAVLNPPSQRTGGQEAAAGRNLRMAEMHLKNGSFTKALEAAQKALEKDPGLAQAHAVSGAALAGNGDCGAAAKSWDKALALDPKNATALDGRKACSAKGK